MRSPQDYTVESIWVGRGVRVRSLHVTVPRLGIPTTGRSVCVTGLEVEVVLVRPRSRHDRLGLYGDLRAV